MTVDAVGGIWRYAMDLGAALKFAGILPLFAGFGPRPSPAQAAEAKRIGELAWLEAPLDWMVQSESALDPIPALLGGLVASAGIDLVHVNLPSQGYGLELDVPVVAVSHSCVVSWFRAVRGAATPHEWRWHEKRNRGGLEAADFVVAPSRSHADLLRTCYGPIDKLRVIHNAATDAPASGPKEDFVFAAGRWWDEGKNAAVLDAAATNCRWRVVMAGPDRGPNGQHFPIRNAEHLGEITNTQVRAMMSRAAIVASPSIYEPFGLAALEAARAGAALVLADIPTYRELWDGAALFAEARSVRAFEEAIDRLAADKAMRAGLAERARQRSQRFSVAAQAKATIDVYAAAMQAAAHRRAEVA